MSSRKYKGTNNYKGFKGRARNWVQPNGDSEALLARLRHLWLRLYNIDVRLAIAISLLRKSFRIAMLLCGVCLFIGQSATAQQFRPKGPSSADSRLTDGSNPTVAALPAPPAAPSTHAFWDRTNLALFSGIAVTRGMDYASTRNFQARGRQEILLPDAVVNNSAGFASLEAAATMTSVGISYILHRTGHHTLERWMSIGHISVTGFGDVRNYSLESRHP
jgi:hypothetical protein